MGRAKWRSREIAARLHSIHVLTLPHSPKIRTSCRLRVPSPRRTIEQEERNSGRLFTGKDPRPFSGRFPPASRRNSLQYLLGNYSEVRSHTCSFRLSNIARTSCVHFFVSLPPEGIRSRYIANAGPSFRPSAKISSCKDFKTYCGNSLRNPAASYQYRTLFLGYCCCLQPWKPVKTHLKPIMALPKDLPQNGYSRGFHDQYLETHCEYPDARCRHPQKLVGGDPGKPHGLVGIKEKNVLERTEKFAFSEPSWRVPRGPLRPLWRPSRTWEESEGGKLMNTLQQQCIQIFETGFFILSKTAWIFNLARFLIAYGMKHIWTVKRSCASSL